MSNHKGHMEVSRFGRHVRPGINWRRITKTVSAAGIKAAEATRKLGAAFAVLQSSIAKKETER